MPKAYVVYPRTKEIAKSGIKIRGKKKRFTGGSFMNLNENDAKEVSDVYGKQNLHVVEDEQLARAVNAEKWDMTENNNVKVLHHYNFGATKKYASAWDEFEKRRKDKNPKKRKAAKAEVRNDTNIQ